MKNPVPLQFLVGLTRLIAIYFCIRAIDQLFGGIMNYQMMKSMSPPTGVNMPSALAIYVPGLLIYIVIAVGVWFAAPLVCRIAIPPASAEELQPDSQTCWNEVMIFLVGTLFVGIGISRLSAILITIYNVSRARVEALGYKFDFADKASMVTTVVLIGCGIILMKRFPSIHRWIQSKSLAGNHPSITPVGALNRSTENRMQRKHLTIILSGLILVLIVALATAIHGCGHRGHPVLGTVILEPNRESNISVSMSRILLQPWRLLFGMPGGFDGESGYSGKVSISVTNDDKVPLLIDLGRGRGMLNISPSNSHKLFEGTFDEMFMLGRTAIQEMTFVSSNDRRVHATFKFSHDLKDRSLEVILSTWRITYGP